MESVTGRPWSGNVTSDVAAYLLPYNDKPDPALAVLAVALATFAAAASAGPAVNWNRTVTVTPAGQERGMTVELLCNDALQVAGLTLAACPRAEVSNMPRTDPFKARVPGQ